MSSLAAWVGVDSRGPASFYFASDSRITWEGGDSRWDLGRKLFASSASSDIFGYCGDVLFPSLVLGQVDSLLTRGILFGADDRPADRHDRVRRIMEGSFGTYPHPVRNPFTILHAAREYSGMRSQFRFWRTDWAKSAGWSDQEIGLPTESVLVLAVGSGAEVVTRRNHAWRERLSRTSRSVFGAFSDALKSGEDGRSGGAPQLVGLYRTNAALVFGIIFEAKRYVCGLEMPEAAGLGSIEWRNELFERCDCRTLQRLPDAQRQPRPWRTP